MTDEKDITKDFLLCNRCGACRAVCPVFDVYREEWAGARGKVELAEAFFRGEAISDAEILKIFDLCLHCMTCEENCPSGMRADEIVLAVKAEMARRGRMPRLKAAALSTIRRMDAGIFRAMRRAGLVNRETIHGYAAGSPLGFLFPMIGWPAQRSVPLPAPKPFLGNTPEFFPASGSDLAMPGAPAGDPHPAKPGRAEAAPASAKTRILLDLARRAREENIAKGTRVYYFIGHAVNHFFPEEASDIVRLLNLLGIDVIVPADQECCGAPFFYAGDIEAAREAAAIATDRIAGHGFDWVVTSCASGGRMLKEEFPRLFGLSSDGFFEVGWDPETEVFFRAKGRSEDARKYGEAGAKYRKHIESRVLDINELLAKVLGLEKMETGFDDAFGPGRREERGQDAGEGGGTPAGHAERPGQSGDEGDEVPTGNANQHGGEGSMPVVTYHQPCHLGRGQGVDWQPEALLELLPGYRYVRMPDADRCCGGGGAFTFTHSKASEEVAARKMDAVASASPDIVSTSCPVCRIQLMDMLRRRFVLEAEREGREARRIAVRTPAELLYEELRKALEGRPEAAQGE